MSSLPIFIAPFSTVQRSGNRHWQRRDVLHHINALHCRKGTQAGTETQAAASVTESVPVSLRICKYLAQDVAVFNHSLNLRTSKVQANFARMSNHATVAKVVFMFLPALPVDSAPSHTVQLELQSFRVQFPASLHRHGDHEFVIARQGRRLHLHGDTTSSTERKGGKHTRVRRRHIFASNRRMTFFGRAVKRTRNLQTELDFAGKAS